MKKVLAKSKKRNNLKQSRVETEDPTFNNHGEDYSDPWRIFRIMTEFVSGFDFLKKYPKAATLFGSARFSEDNKSYKEAVKLASLLAKDGFAIATGGGPGIMEAANRGAADVGGASVGLAIKIPSEQSVNKYVNSFQEYKYFFTRKVMLVYASQIYVFFPGGYGTLDELFELLTLVKTHKIQPLPIILVDKDFWTPLCDWIEKTLVAEYNTVNANEAKLYHLVDTADEAYQLIEDYVKDTTTLQHPDSKNRRPKTAKRKRS